MNYNNQFDYYIKMNYEQCRELLYQANDHEEDNKIEAKYDIIYVFLSAYIPIPMNLNKEQKKFMNWYIAVRKILNEPFDCNSENWTERWMNRVLKHRNFKEDIVYKFGEVKWNNL